MVFAQQCELYSGNWILIFRLFLDCSGHCRSLVGYKKKKGRFYFFWLWPYPYSITPKERLEDLILLRTTKMLQSCAKLIASVKGISLSLSHINKYFVWVFLIIIIVTTILLLFFKSRALDEPDLICMLLSVRVMGKRVAFPLGRTFFCCEVQFLC